jgi:nickel transport protein
VVTNVRQIIKQFEENEAAKERIIKYIMTLDIFRIISRCVIITVMFTASPYLSFSHGTEGGITEKRGWMVQAVYDDGETMSYTETEIFHEPQTLPFQKGRTDRNGRFLFYPDAPGTWRIEVKDEMGHAVILKKEISNGNLSESRTESPSEPMPSSDRSGKLSKALAGVGLISFVSGFFFWVTARKKTEEDRNAESEQ